MKKLMVILLAAFCSNAFGQTELEDDYNAVDLGLGLGINYGGIGASLNVHADPHFLLFASAGYALAGFGYNFGGKIRFNPKNKFCVTAAGMYGYNAALKVSDQNHNTLFKKIYTGFSMQIGGDLRRKNSRNYWAFGLILPFRPAEFQRDVDKWKGQGADVPGLPPIGISAGYHIGI